jgi:hypothetical protein
VVYTTPVVAAEPPAEVGKWTIFIANDNCPDYTWGFSEQQTRKAFADVVKGHLDEMTRTDGQPPENRDRYNAAVTQEVLCFVEHYPERKEELIRRIKEGRLYVSPYLCNSLWAFQGVEGAIRTFYPARRLERDWGITIDCAHHIELPSLPWGTPTILAGCGLRNLSVPYYGYDSPFGGLRTPPIFIHEGPDGSRVKVVMDRFACGKSSYTQGANVLGKSDAIDKEWIAHYAGLGAAYPLRAILASGTHGDISPGSGNQARGLAEKIIQYNARPGPRPKLVNATFPQFWQAVEQEESRKPWLPTVRGDFGHSWDLWPVSLAKYAADMREGERMLLAAEALLSVAAHNRRFRPELVKTTQADRQRAEWCLAMLSDHAWNGTDERNQRHNADLRRQWSEELNRIAQTLLEQGWSAAGLQRHREQDSIVLDSLGLPRKVPASKYTFLTVFNPLSLPRKGLVRIEVPEKVSEAFEQGPEGRRLPSQIAREDGRRMLYFVSPEVPGFGIMVFQLKAESEPAKHSSEQTAPPTALESPHYRAAIDSTTGGLSSLVHKATGTELRAAAKGRALCQTVYFDGKEHTLSDVKSEVTASGPVFARLRVTGKAQGIEVTSFVTVYEDLDQVDFDLRINKPVSTKQDRLCQVFPVLRDGSTLRIATTGAVIRPRPQPEGDLLPGADTRRFAVQEFLNVSSENIGVTIAPLDAFVLRMDLDPVSIEAIGNDQNYKEVVKDQNGVTSFRFRYALRAHAGGYDGRAAMAFGRSAATPLLAAIGRTPEPDKLLLTVDPARAIATCFKPADDAAAGGFILRLSEVAGQPGPVTIAVSGYKRAVQTDLLERDIKELKIVDGKVTFDLKPHGFAALRLLP